MVFFGGVLWWCSFVLFGVLWCFWCSLVFFGVRCLNAFNVQFPSNLSFINFMEENVFHSLSKNCFPILQSFLLAWLSHIELLKMNLALFVS